MYLILWSLRSDLHRLRLHLRFYFFFEKHRMKTSVHNGIPEIKNITIKQADLIAPLVQFTIKANKNVRYFHNAIGVILTLSCFDIKPRTNLQVPASPLQVVVQVVLWNTSFCQSSPRR